MRDELVGVNFERRNARKVVLGIFENEIGRSGGAKERRRAFEAVWGSVCDSLVRVYEGVSKSVVVALCWLPCDAG